MKIPNSENRIPWIFALAGIGILVAIWLLREALTPFFISMVFAYLLAPLVERLSRHIPRVWAVVSVLLTFTLILLVLSWLASALLEGQLGKLAASLPRWRANLEARLVPWLHAHPWVEENARKGLQEFDPMLLLKGLSGAGLGLLNAFLRILTFILVPVILYYMLLDGPRILFAFDALVPPRHRDLVRKGVNTVHERLGGYIRGQFSVCVAMSILQGIGFACFGVPYAWLLALIAGFSNVVPYSPYLTALVPALIIAGLDGTGAGILASMALAFTAIQKIEALYLTPVWVGRACKLHPLEVLLAILAFGFAFGIVGLIFAVPLMIAFKAVAEIFIAHYKAHPWFERDGNNPIEEKP